MISCESIKQTRPYVILGKYRSLLLSAIITESVAFLVSLTDSLVAGNVVNADAFAAIGLLTPFFFVSSFFAATINAGTLSNYNEQIGSFHQDRAHAYFSQGFYLSLLAGAVHFAVMLLCRRIIFIGLEVPPGMAQYLSDYYNIIVIYFLLYPASCLLSNIVISDGGEKLSLVVNVLQILTNVILSLILSYRIGVKGIALATVISTALSILLVVPWFFTKRNTLRLVRIMSPGDCLDIIRRGCVRASTLILTAAAFFILNAFVAASFGGEVLQTLILQEKILGLSSVFMGLSMTIQPLVSTLMGENNTKAARILLRHASLVMVSTGALISVLLILFAEPFVKTFGISDPAQVQSGRIAASITGSTLICSALLVFFFFYYFLINRYRLALTICFIKDVLSLVGLAVLFVLLFHTPDAIWPGLALAPVLSLLIGSGFLYFHYGKDLFPFLLPMDQDERIFIYSFPLDESRSVSMSKKAAELLSDKGYSHRSQTLTALYLEEMLMLILEKNKAGGVLVECTLILEEEDVRMILRDTGLIFDLTDDDALPDSFRQYVVANMTSVLDNKVHLVTTGYNRHEFVFPVDNKQ